MKELAMAIGIIASLANLGLPLTSGTICCDFFTNPEIMSINWLRNYVDGRLTVSGGYATVTYATLYFIDNNSDQLIDPNAAQFFLFATETD